MYFIFSISGDTLYSILSSEYQRKMRWNYGKTQNNRNKYWDMFKKGMDSKESPGVLVRLAETFDVPPCLMARLILQKHFDDQEDKTPDREGPININRYLKNTCLIPDPDLAYEVFLVCFKFISTHISINILFLVYNF